ncbi:MAG TPA: hypothetical protein VHX20_03985 [Terracidiphilus sp.]|nr:hypothetical protein [Terracidiphilus sp.]
MRDTGHARVVYFPWDVDRTLWEVMDVDHAKLLRNAVLWATNEMQPVSVKGRGVVDISVFTQRQSMTVHLVNLTNPMMMKGPVREAIPLSSQQVRIRIPANKRVSRARLLVAGNELPYRMEDGVITAEIPSIEVHEVVALDFAT